MAVMNCDREHQRMAVNDSCMRGFLIGKIGWSKQKVNAVLSIVVLASLTLTACGVGSIGTTITETGEPDKSHAWQMTEEMPVPSAETPSPIETPVFAPIDELTNAPVQTVEATPARVLKHPEFSAEYQPSFVEKYVANVHGLQIPINIGLTHQVVSRKKTPIESMYLSQKFVDLWGDIYLRSCYHRYKVVMGREDAENFEGYIDLLKKGEGHLEMAVYDESSPGKKMAVKTIDPLNGWSVSYTDQGNLPLEFSQSLFLYYGVNKDGQLVMAIDLSAAHWDMRVRELKNENLADSDEMFYTYIVGGRLQLLMIMIAVLEDRCAMSNRSVVRTCGNVSAPTDWVETMGDYFWQIDRYKRGEIEALVVPNKPDNSLHD